MNSYTVDFNSQGVGFGLWTVNAAGVDRLFASRYTEAGGWEPEEQIDLVGGNFASTNPQVRVDDAGNAIAVWLQSDGVRGNVWSAHFSPAIGWDAAQLIETGLMTAESPSIDMDSAGNVIAAWAEYNGTGRNISANRYVAGTGWGSAALIEGDIAGSSIDAHVAVARNGDAVVVWDGYDGLNDHIWQNTFTIAGGWGTETRIESDTRDAYAPRIAVDGSGRFLVVWSQWNGTQNIINSSSFSRAAGWSVPITVASDATFGLNNPDLAMNGRGDALLGFQLYDSGAGWAGAYYTYVVAYRVGSGWEPAPTVIYNVSGNSTHDIHVAIDDWGHGAVAFGVDSGGWTSRPDIAAAAWDINQGWYPSERIETVNSGYAYLGAIAPNGQGKFFALFNIEGPEIRIWGNWMSWADTAAPALAITSPTEGAVFDATPLRVNGTTEAGAHLVVNGLAVDVADDGSWWVDLPLSPGNNTITVEAVDAAGNDAYRAVTVWYTDPATYIQADLSATRAQLAQTQSQLAATQNQLSGVYSSLNATRVDLQTTKDSLASTQSNLTATKSELGAANTNVAGAQGGATLGVVLGLVGILIGAFGVIMAMQAMKKANQGGSSSSSSSPPAQPRA